MSTPMGPEELQHLAAEVGRLFGLYHEQVDHLMTERTQENERLRADLGRLEVEIARTNQDNDRLRAERDELLAAFHRMADVVDQVRHSRGGRDRVSEGLVGVVLHQRFSHSDQRGRGRAGGRDGGRRGERVGFGTGGAGVVLCRVQPPRFCL